MIINARDIIRPKPREELFGVRSQSWKVAVHTARHIQHDDKPHRLQRVVEQRDRLRLALVRDSKSSCFRSVISRPPLCLSR